MSMMHWINYESLSADLKDFGRPTPVKDNLVVGKPSVNRSQMKKFPPLLKPKKRNQHYLGEQEF